MDDLSRTDLAQLIEQHEGPCVSIYLPTFRAGIEVQQNPIRVKNLLRKAQDQLQHSGLSPMDAHEFLQPAASLLNDAIIWQHMETGLAIFLARDFANAYRLPCSFLEKVVVNRKFHLKPLFPLFSTDGLFYILAVSQKHVRFLECMHHSVRQIELPDMPKGIGDILQYYEVEKQTQYRTAAVGAPGRGIAMFHGHGGGGHLEGRHKVHITQFLKDLGESLPGDLKSRAIPVVFAGVDYLFPMFREVASCKGLLEEPISGNPEELSNEELHAEAWQIVEPHFRDGQNRATELYHQFKHNKRASHNIREIVPAAREGRVETLFVTLEKTVLGKFDPEINEVSLSQKHASELEDLLDLAAVETYLHDGAVYAMRDEEMPEQTPIAAVFRY